MPKGRYRWIVSIIMIMALATISLRLVRASPIRNAAFLTPNVKSSPLQRWKRTLFSESLPSSMPLDEGDTVQMTVDGELVHGIVKERRGGWYSVQVPSTDGGDHEVLKVRRKQLMSILAEPVVAPDVTGGLLPELQVSEPVFQLPPPTIIDLDAAIQSLAIDTTDSRRDRLYLEQCAYHASFTKWVMFTDLHCAPSSVDTCLEVLRTVHALALERQAGVLFLGDWWHHRGTIRIDLLNTVLDALQSWQVPMVLVPGNHDQVTLGGHVHGLTPLENAYRVEHQDSNGIVHSFPGPLVFSHPTKFGNAFFVPHIRDHTIMESVLRSDIAAQSAALFVHADVTGAYMNDLIVSQGGVSPSCFPPSRPTYSGHFHKPHIVKSGKVCIEYVGSPYETSLAEAGQPKALLVLDAANNWECIERIPLSVGRRHFRATTLAELMSLGISTTETVENNKLLLVKSGDRVVVTMAKDDIEEIRRSATEGQLSAFDAQVKALRQNGAVVEVREQNAVALEPVGTGGLDDVSKLEEMTPQTTLVSFFKEEVRREAIKNGTAEDLLKAGLVLLDELESVVESPEKIYGGGNMTNLSLESVTLQGFGPFKDQVTYPLLDRGLVLVRGSNKDGGADSNGSGKSSLAMSTLWALTGTIDPRPMQDAKVADVVNDLCTSAKVSIRGKLNGEPFVITRTKTSSKGALVFHLAGVDLTTQSVKETQAIIDEKLGVGPQILARTMFHGQHSMNGLLEATDAKLKDELALVVPLSLWQEGASMARAKSRDASKQASELQGMITLRSNDIEELRRRRDHAKDAAAAKWMLYNETEVITNAQVRALQNSTEDFLPSGMGFDALHEALNASSNEVEFLESELQQLITERDTDVLHAEAYLYELSELSSSATDALQVTQRDYDRATLKLETAKEILRTAELKWNVKLSPTDQSDFATPTVCPTCQQPLGSTGDGHSHHDIQIVIRQELDVALRNVDLAENALESATVARNTAAEFQSLEQRNINAAQDSLKRVKSTWSERIHAVEMQLGETRKTQRQRSEQVSHAAKILQRDSEIKSIEATLSLVRDAAEASEATYRNLEKEVVDAEMKLMDLQKSSEAQRSLSATMTGLVDVFGQRGVQTFVLQNAIEALQVISQGYLDELSDGTQRLDLSFDAGDRISRTAYIRAPDGSLTERPLSSLSGGQWRRCSLALSLGFADLVARRGRLRPSLCVLDEPLTHLDRSGRTRVGSLLRHLLERDDTARCLDPNGISVTTILVILQDLAAEELEESFDRIDEVVKEGGLSSVAIDEYS